MATAAHPFRFGLMATGAITARDWRETALRADASGFSTLLLPDTGGPMLSPFSALAVAAAATTRLRVGTWVLANDLRNPVAVAREAATLDVLSEGRFELGLGAGRDDNPAYATMGIRLDPGSVRLARLAEAVDIVQRLFRGETVTTEGRHYAIAEATLFPRPSRRPPLVLAAGGKRAMELAARHADTVALGGMSAAEIARRLAWLREAGDRDPEVSLTVFPVPEDDAARRAMVAERARWGMDLEGMIAEGSPRVLVGSPAAMAEQLEQRRATLGISYVVGDDERALAQLIPLLAGK